MTTSSQLGVELSRIVAEVPGVRRLYPAAHPGAGVLAGAAGAARGVVASATGSLSAVLGTGASTAEVVGVTSHHGEIQVVIRLGVLNSASAAEVCRAVHDQVADYLATHTEGSVASISVKVARIG